MNRRFLDYTQLAMNVISIIALGYLTFSILSIFNVSSKRIDKIEKSQQIITEKAEKIILSQERMLHKADSIDSLQSLKLYQITQKISGVEKNQKETQANIGKLREGIIKNRVDLPNPWEK